MFSKMLKPAVVFVMLMAFVVAPVGITISETSYSNKECTLLVMVGKCGIRDLGNGCATSLAIVDVESEGDCDTYKLGSTCYEFGVTRTVGTKRCTWKDGDCTSSWDSSRSETFTNCRNG